MVRMDYPFFPFYKCLSGAILEDVITPNILNMCTLCRMTQPLLLGRLIRYFSPHTDVSRKSAFLYAAGVIVCSIINVFVKQPYMMAISHVGMKISIGLCSLLYRKASILRHDFYLYLNVQFLLE
jgi:hypothetical protein